MLIGLLESSKSPMAHMRVAIFLLHLTRGSLAHQLRPFETVAGIFILELEIRTRFGSSGFYLGQSWTLVHPYHSVSNSWEALSALASNHPLGHLSKFLSKFHYLVAFRSFLQCCRRSVFCWGLSLALRGPWHNSHWMVRHATCRACGECNRGSRGMSGPNQRTPGCLQ